MAQTRFDQVEARIGYIFADRDLLVRALTHASHGDGRRDSEDNQRLEFLGDRVLGLLTAEALITRFDQADEGGLAPRFNALVKRETCARVARRAKLGSALRMSRAEADRGGREKDSILGDACEALVGALFLDGGLDAARSFFARFWAEEFAGVDKRPQDPKSKLQEEAAARGLGVPRYALADRTGPEHRPVFTITVAVDGQGEASGEGGSKQAAERAAAAALLTDMGVDA